MAFHVSRQPASLSGKIPAGCVIKLFLLAARDAFLRWGLERDRPAFDFHKMDTIAVNAHYVYLQMAGSPVPVYDRRSESDEIPAGEVLAIPAYSAAVMPTIFHCPSSCLITAVLFFAGRS